MLREFRFGFRMLLKQPAFSLIAVFTLALGIGATSAVFSLIQGVLMTPPPYRDPERLVLIPSARADGQKPASPRGWAPAQWLEWQKQAKTIDGLAAYFWSFTFLIRSDGSQSMQGMGVSKDYFHVVGLQPLLGRSFTESDIGTGPPRVIILGYRFWQQQFNGDPHILGKSVRLSRRDTLATVIGVMPPEVRFLPSPTNAQEPNYDVNAQVDFWVPFTPDPARLKQPDWDVIARLREGVTARQAQEELTVLAAREAQSDRDFAGMIPRVERLSGEFNRDGRRILFPLLGAAALVLLIACGNAAALLLIRGLQRQQEYGVRRALGMGRSAFLRQIVTESLLLACLGGVLGAGLAFGVVKLFKAIGGHAIPRLDAVTPGWPVLLWGLGMAIVATLIAGLLPALRISALDPMQVLKSAGPKSSAGRGERRLLRGVTVAQTALTLALLTGAGLLIRTMMNIADVRSGYDTSRILTMSVTAVQGDWYDFHRRALERVSAIPGVQHAAFAWGVPLTGNNWPATVDIEGQPEPDKESDRIPMPLRSVTPDYFRLLGQPILQGRGFRSTDDRNAQNVAIVNQAFADRYFAGRNPIGRKIWFRRRQDPATLIVGEVSNSRTDDLTRAATAEVYLSMWQATPFSKHLLIRSAADPRSVVASVQRELRSVDPTVAIEHLKTLEQIRDESLASRTFAMQLLVGFSIVGTALTLIGIYGVLALSVASRRRELAIRTAVGAKRADIRNLIFGEGFRLIAAGVLSGAAAAIILARVLRSFLFEVGPGDPGTLLAVALSFGAVALLACWIPVRRATRVDPIEALRYE